MDNLTTSSLTELRVVTIAIKDNYLWVIMALGFPGNLLTFFTILSIRPRLRFTVYVAALAVVDNMCLVTKVININLNQRHVNMGDFGCQFLQYWGSLTGQWANWLLVMMTAERLIDITMKRHFSVSRLALEKRKRFQRQITIMTMFTCVVFSILVIPRPVQHLFMADFKRRKVPYDENLQFFLTNIFFVMSDSSHAVNFYIYFLSNKFFRKQLYEKLNNLIKGIKTCPAQSPQFSNLHGRYTRSSWTKQTAI
uniref:G-protein coupled receptors family 1 profile domain-containing protein n=1 Tax=Biomphalaria glabrata TaxID=6526 RepID=A0A2C9KP47_BIOGL